MLKFFEKIIPRYSWIPFIIAIVMFAVAFQLTRLFNSGWYHYDLSVPLDEKIPFVKEFILVYILAYVQWVVEFIRFGRQPEGEVYKIVSAMVTGTVICGIIYLIFPTVLERPEADGNGLTGLILKIVYSADAPDNLFPSLHCFSSWWCIRSSVSRKGESAAYKVVTVIVSLTVFAAVVLVKQHLVVDIIGGIAAAELGILISRLVRGDRLFALINRRVFGVTEKGDESVKEYSR